MLISILPSFMLGYVKNMKCRKLAGLLSLLIFTLVGMNDSVCAKEVIVHAVLFYSPSCPHCHKVIQEDLPPIIEKYGEQVIIIGINTQAVEGQEIYLAMTEYFELPPERKGVPTLVVGEIVLVGSLEIPQQLPGIIDKGLEEGGIDWPTIPGLADLIADSIAMATAQAEYSPQITQIVPEPSAEINSSKTTATADPTMHSEFETNTPGVTKTVYLGFTSQKGVKSTPTILGRQLSQEGSISFDEQLEDQSITEKFMRDPIGNTSSVIVLSGMLVCVFVVGVHLNFPHITSHTWPLWVIPTLAMVGLIVAGYLSYVEVTQTEAVCGPVGDCNTVQQSHYALLFGMIPIGLLGLLGYLAITIAWGIQHYGPVRLRKYAGLGVWFMALVGTLFSVYLTFLEPFVIGATCAWCLTSAIVMTLIFLAATSYTKRDLVALFNLIYDSP